MTQSQEPPARPRESSPQSQVSAAPEVRDAPDRHRFEIWVGDEVAGFTDYRPRRDDLYAFVHTEIDTRFSGGGLGSTLIRAAMDEMRERGISVLPYCRFVRRYISRHSEYLDLVPRTARAEFDLPGAAPNPR
jgi:predicted GNAT family acetyltransferase